VSQWASPSSSTFSLVSTSAGSFDAGSTRVDGLQSGQRVTFTGRNGDVIEFTQTGTDFVLHDYRFGPPPPASLADVTAPRACLAFRRSGQVLIFELQVFWRPQGVGRNYTHTVRMVGTATLTPVPGQPPPSQPVQMFDSAIDPGFQNDVLASLNTVSNFGVQQGVQMERVRFQLTRAEFLRRSPAATEDVTARVLAALPPQAAVDDAGTPTGAMLPAGVFEWVPAFGLNRMVLTGDCSQP
jgi:hypothetical protein